MPPHPLKSQSEASNAKSVAEPRSIANERQEILTKED